MHDHAGRDPTLPMIAIARGEGACLIDQDGNRYLDAVSSWWTNIFGHANPRIAAAVKHQLDTLEHVMFAGFTHEPAIELAEELIRIAPRRTCVARVFRRQRIERDRSRAEDELPLLAQQRQSRTRRASSR